MLVCECVIFFIFDKFSIFRELFEVIVDFFLRVSFINRGEEMNKYGNTNSCFCFDTGLNAVNSFPETVICSSSEFIDELGISDYLYSIIFYKSKYCCVFVIDGFFVYLIWVVLLILLVITCYSFVNLLFLWRIWLFKRCT